MEFACLGPGVDFKSASRVWKGATHRISLEVCCVTHASCTPAKCIIMIISEFIEAARIMFRDLGGEKRTEYRWSRSRCADDRIYFALSSSKAPVEPACPVRDKA